MQDKFDHTILLVDDEDGILKSLRRLLKTLGANVVTASNGEAALEILKNREVSLIISDQRMPGMTGVDMLRRSRDTSPNSIRILLTGYADIDATVDAINSGAVKYYFNKPWDDDSFVSRIKESLDLYAAKAENSRLQKLTYLQNRQLKELNENLERRVEEQTIEIREQHEELKQSFMETIKAFSTFIELRHKEVGSHSQRVASLAKNILKGFQLNQKEYQDIVVAAYLHDIGKISLPDKVLKKNPDDYGAGDRELVHKHPILGQSCVYGISGFEEIGVIIRHHHENYDGQGYPDNLKEKRIPLGSRIIRLCDAFDHRAFKGSYPDVKTLNEASAMLVQFSGSEFDPELIKRFIDIDIARQLYQDDFSDVAGLKPSELKEGMIVAADINTRNGMFLLPKGAKLSEGIIKRINKINAVDPITDVIMVFKQRVASEEEHVPA